MGTLIALPQSELYTFPRRLLTLPMKETAKSPDHLLLEEEDGQTLTRKHSGEDRSALFLPGEENQDSLQVNETRDPQGSLSQDTLRAYILTHSLGGHKMFVTRTPFVGEIKTVKSPCNPDVTFGLKRVGNREVMAHRDKNASIRYIQREGSDEYISEKDYPVGTLRVDTVALVLESWNLADAAGKPVKIEKESILSYLEPEELDFLYDQAMEINPILAGQPARKNDSSVS